MAQSVERRIGSAEVTGPIPVSSCNIKSSKNLDKMKVFTTFLCALYFNIRNYNKTPKNLATELKLCTKISQKGK